MNKARIFEQVEIIREAFGYIERFKGETFVIKIDSTLIAHPVFAQLMRDLVHLQRIGINMVLVPGARQRIDEVLQSYQLPTTSNRGVRISTAEAIPFIKMAAFDVSNQVMTQLAQHGVHAVIGNWVKARGIGVRDGIDYQHSGIVEKLATPIIRRSIDDGLIPIFPNIGWSGTGTPYNISSNELAFTLACELQAAKLFFITQNDGLSLQGLTLPPDVFYLAEVQPALRVDQAEAVVAANREKPYDERLELLSLGTSACRRGVRRVHIVGGLQEGAVLTEIFSNRGSGAMIYANQFDNIRPMTYADIPDVLRIMNPLVQQSILVHRTAEELMQRMDDYVVFEVDEVVHGCGALHRYGTDAAEIAGVAIDEEYASLGIGRRILLFLKLQAEQQRVKKLFLLTTQTADWFVEQGFSEGSLEDLPAEKRASFNTERNSTILIYRPQRSGPKFSAVE
jgi:amino-acid N-acetyltransferase